MIRPEVAEFYQKLSRIMAETEKENKRVAEENKKMAEELRTKLQQAHQKQQQTVVLEKELAELKAEDEMIAELIDESKEREKEYEVFFKQENDKLAEANKHRLELLSMKGDNGIQEFINIQESIDKQLQQLQLASRPSQEIAIADERSALINEVHAKECYVKSLTDELQELKKKAHEMIGETFTTSEEQRSEALNFIRELTQQLHGGYITSKLELHKYKNKL